MNKTTNFLFTCLSEVKDDAEQSMKSLLILLFLFFCFSLNMKGYDVSFNSFEKGQGPWTQDGITIKGGVANSEGVLNMVYSLKESLTITGGKDTKIKKVKIDCSSDNDDWIAFYGSVGYFETNTAHKVEAIITEDVSEVKFRLTATDIRARVPIDFIYVEFTGGSKSYTLTLKPNNTNYGNVVGGGTYAEGSSHIIYATPADGYHFVNWSNGNTNSNYQYTSTKNEELTANFAPHCYDTKAPSGSYQASPATCQHKATYYYKCSGCNGMSKLVTPYEYGELADHKYIVASSPESNGLYSYICEYGCGTKRSDEKVIKNYTAEEDLVLNVNNSGQYSTETAIKLTDENNIGGVNVSFSAPSAPTYTRTMKNKWGTLVVPFSVAYDSSKPYDLYQLSGVSGVTLTLTKVMTTIAAGTPVIVRMSEGAKSGDNYVLSLTAANKTVSTTGNLTGTQKSGLTLTGSYAVAEVTNNDYIISNNAFWKASGLKDNDDIWKDGNTDEAKTKRHVYCSPFRAYLAGSTSSGAKMLSIGWNDDEDITAVETLDALTSDEAQYYDINGHRLNDLQQGINIVKRGNKTYKVIIK